MLTNDMPIYIETVPDTTVYLDDTEDWRVNHISKLLQRFGHEPFSANNVNIHWRSNNPKSLKSLLRNWLYRYNVAVVTERPSSPQLKTYELCTHHYDTADVTTRCFWFRETTGT
jgi:hypothetical protein